MGIIIFLHVGRRENPLLFPKGKVWSQSERAIANETVTKPLQGSGMRAAKIMTNKKLCEVHIYA